MKTMTEKLVAGLIALGCREVTSNSRKYRQFTRILADLPNESYYFVGKAGALRVGRCASDTVALGAGAKARILAAGEGKK